MTRTLAVIGAGPGGLIAARWLLSQGFEPTIFEQGPKLDGQWTGLVGRSGVWPAMHKGALSAEQKATLAPRLVQALIRQEIAPVTEIGTAATGFFFNELDVENCFPGGVPLSEHPDKVFWTVEAFVAASYFSQPRRDEMQRDIAAAFVDVLGNDGSVLQRDDIRIAPAYLMRLHVIVVEIPEGSWGAGGQTIDTEKISKLIGATEGPARLAEALELGEKMKNARLS